MLSDDIRSWNISSVCHSVHLWKDFKINVVSWDSVIFHWENMLSRKSLLRIAHILISLPLFLQNEIKMVFLHNLLEYFKQEVIVDKCRQVFIDLSDKKCTIQIQYSYMNCRLLNTDDVFFHFYLPSKMCQTHSPAVILSWISYRFFENCMVVPFL